MAQISHVNLCMPPDVIDAEAAFLVEILDYKELNPGKRNVALGTRWFEFADGSQIHLNIYPPERDFHRGAALGHVALQVDDLDLFRSRIQERGIEPRVIDFDGMYGFVVPDPVGNIWEIRAEYPYLGLLEG
jgi:hypothetical protein